MTTTQAWLCMLPILLVGSSWNRVFVSSLLQITRRNTRHYHFMTSNRSTDQTTKLVVIVAGPTASGKSDVAAILCRTNHGLIVSADSVQAYPHVQIGANKPTATELSATPHLLIDVVEPNDTNILNYSVNDWRRDAMYVIRRMFSEPIVDDDTEDASDATAESRRRKLDATIQAARDQSGTINANESSARLVPFVVGGSMMYLQWLVHGRPDAVRPSETAVQRAHQDLTPYQETKDWSTAVQTLIDPLGSPYVKQLDKISGDRQDWYRLRRILEVAYTLHEKQRHDGDANEAVYSGVRTGGLLAHMNYDVRCFFLCPDDRMKHTKVVDRRCEDMIGRGLFTETTDLVLAGHMPDMVQRAIGYRQTLDYLQREAPKDDDVDQFADYVAQFTAATRQYSKKQMQWFRRDAAFTFVPVPISSVPDKDQRVQAVAAHIQQLIQMPRDEYDQQRTSRTSDSTVTRARNEAQAKGMKVYQLVKQVLVPGSKELAEAMAEADRCTHRLQAKRPKQS